MPGPPDPTAYFFFFFGRSSFSSRFPPIESALGLTFLPGLAGTFDIGAGPTFYLIHTCVLSVFIVLPGSLFPVDEIRPGD